MKIFFENNFTINSAEYTGSVRNLYCEGDFLLKKTTCTGFFGTRALVLTKLIQKNFSAKAGATLNFKNYRFKKVSIRK